MVSSKVRGSIETINISFIINVYLSDGAVFYSFVLFFIVLFVFFFLSPGLRRIVAESDKQKRQDGIGKRRKNDIVF